MAVKRRKSLPPIPPDAPVSLRPLYAAMAEIIETGEGVRGDRLDRKLTVRDLVGSGFELRIPGNPEGGFVPPNNVPELDLTPPPPPTGFRVMGGFFGVITLTWDIIDRKYANNFAYTNVYRSAEDNFANAQIIGRTLDRIYADKVRTDIQAVDDPLILPGYYYWISHVSKANIEGPPSSPDGVFARPLPDAELLLAQLSGQLEESHLAQILRDRLNAFDRVDGNLNTRITNLSQVVTEGDTQLAEQLQQVIAAYKQADTDNAAFFQQEIQAQADALSAQVQATETLASRVGDNEAAIQQQSTVVSGLSASWTLTTDVNGYVTGFGSYNDGKRGDFAVTADRFWIATPGSTAKVKPFMVVNGVVYMDTAFIREGSIQSGQLGPINFGKLVDNAGNPVTTINGQLRADKVDIASLTVGNAQISGDLWSYATNPYTGRPLWVLGRHGGFELNSAGYGGRVTQNHEGIKVFDTVRLRVQIGNLNA